jgi:hypothetical protein
MSADSMVLPASHPPVPDAQARRLFPVIALLLLAMLAALAPRLHNAPVDLAPTWLGAGLATVLALRLPSWPVTVLMAAAMGLGGAVAHAQGLPVPGLALFAAMAAVTTAQARFSARCSHRLLGDRLLFPHRPPVELLGQGVTFALRCVLAPALLAGAAIGVLQWLVGAAALLPVAAVKLGLLYAAASSLSILLFTPMWGGWIGQLPSRVLAGLLWLASAALAWLASGNLEALYAAPVIALAAGLFGGWRLAALCVATMAASLMLGVNFAHLPPFEGPDGFVLLLLFIWRLIGMGFFVSVWSERRQLGRAAVAAQPGALQCNDPEQLLRHFRASAARLAQPTDHHGWICIELGGPQSDGGTSSPDRVVPATAPLLSSHLRSAMRAAAQVLRPGDGVLPLAGDMLLVVLPGLAPAHLITVAARIKAALGGQLAETRVMGEHVVHCLLQSQVYFALESD